MDKLNITYVDPNDLHFASWNPNEVDPIAFQKIVNSIKKNDFYTPLHVREKDDGTLEIIGGEHRTKAAIEMGIKSIPVINHGKVDDKKAKQLLLVDNGRYGHENAEKMQELLNSGMGDIDELLSILPYDEDQLENYFSHDSGFEDIDFDDLEGDADDIDLSSASAPTKTHQIIRFKVGMEDAVKISETITKIKNEQGFDDSDELTNAGDALVYLFSLLNGPQPNDHDA